LFLAINNYRGGMQKEEEFVIKMVWYRFDYLNYVTLIIVNDV
jgi:hypothetical protein